MLSLIRPEFPRSNHYDPLWMLDGQMGPNALWLTEWLTEAMTLTPGMRILDLGCGKALSSIFLAREFDVVVHAVDLWIGPDRNWQRIQDAGVGDRVCPLRAEAHALPFANNYFDAAISIDAYLYFGTDELYLNYLARFVRPGGQLGVVAPGLIRPVVAAEAPHLFSPQSNGKVFWEDECRSFKTADFWCRLWESCASVTNVSVATDPDGWRHWRDFERAIIDAGKGFFPSDDEALDRDQGQFIGVHRLVAQRSERQGPNLYDPNLGLLVGVE